jgi:D-alanyl-D-alanine carboxypeptidase
MKSTWLWMVPLLLLHQAAFAQPTPDGFIAAYAQEHNFNGSILVKKDGKVRFERSFGLANRPFKVPNTNQTKYWIASITKAFTSVLILQLHEQGKLDLNKTIGTYLPDYAGEGVGKVTIHHLLNHTSGLPNFDSVKDAESAIRSGLPAYQAPFTSDQLLAKFCSGNLVKAPGEAFDYNNGDYIVLGKIIERIYGKPYEQVLRDKILQPLKMGNSGLLHQSDLIDGRADTYFYRDDLKALAPDLPVYPENWYAAGAMYSTVEDLLAFSNALFGARLLKPESLALMTRPGLDDYGYGLWAYETKINGKKYRVVKRPGRIMGAQGQLYRFLDADVTVIILSNTGTTDLDEFVAEIGKRVVG